MCWDNKAKPLFHFGIYNPLLTKDGVGKMKLNVEKAFKLVDGKHEGSIKEITYKETPYKYVDIVVTENKEKLDLRCGVPQHITESSALGIILKNFGAIVKEGEQIEIEEFIKIETAVEFITMTEETKKGTFSRIIPSSLRPKK